MKSRALQRVKMFNEMMLSVSILFLLVLSLAALNPKSHYYSGYGPITVMSLILIVGGLFVIREMFRGLNLKCKQKSNRADQAEFMQDYKEKYKFYPKE